METMVRIWMAAPRLVAAVMAVLALVPALAPALAYWLARQATEPEGFWQEFVLGVAGVLFLGTFQIIFVLVWVAWTCVWTFKALDEADAIKARAQLAARRKAAGVV